MNTIPTPRPLAHWACAFAFAFALAAGRAAADAPLPVASVETVTIFDTYQAWQDAPVADWRAANERVQAVGGWRTYLRESQGDTTGDDAHAHHHHH